MGHIQSKPVHDSDVQHKKSQKTIDVQIPGPTSNNRSPEKEMKHLDNPTAHQPIEEPSHELRILGFPWLFVAVMGIIAGGVLILILKAIGLF